MDPDEQSVLTVVTQSSILISHFFECFRLLFFLPHTVLLHKVKTRVGELLLFRVCWFCLKFANKTLIILNNRSILFFKNMAALL